MTAHHQIDVYGDNRPKLRHALVITLSIAALEAVAGWLSGSIALLGDAGHMLGDSSALAIALLGASVATRPPSQKHSFGLGRADVVAATINGIMLLVIAGVIVLHAVERLRAPPEINAPMVIIVGSIGLGANLLVMRILNHANDLNSRAARLHVLGDLLGSIAATLSGVIILLTGWLPIDALLSMFICVLIVISAIKVLQESLGVFMEAVPAHLDLEDVGRRMAAVERVISVHDLHIWTLSGSRVSLSAHILINRLEDWPATLDALSRVLADEFDIHHVTLQPEPVKEVPLPIPTVPPAHDEKNGRKESK